MRLYYSNSEADFRFLKSNILKDYRFTEDEFMYIIAHRKVAIIEFPKFKMNLIPYPKSVKPTALYAISGEIQKDKIKHWYIIFPDYKAFYYIWTTNNFPIKGTLVKSDVTQKRLFLATIDDILKRIQRTSAIKSYNKEILELFSNPVTRHTLK